MSSASEDKVTPPHSHSLSLQAAKQSNFLIFADLSSIEIVSRTYGETVVSDPTKTKDDFQGLLVALFDLMSCLHRVSVYFYMDKS